MLESYRPMSRGHRPFGQPPELFPVPELIFSTQFTTFRKIYVYEEHCLPSDQLQSRLAI